MPSLFPGMNPFLEHPDHFPNLHQQLIAYIEEALQPALPPPYFVKGGRRVWVEYSERYIEPDLTVQRPMVGQASSGATALLAPPSSHPVIVALPNLPHDEHREGYLEIYARQGDNKRLVTALEVLSPSNKTPGNHGRDLYLQKQRDVMESDAHLVEIDLLRGGVHTSAVPLTAAVQEAGSFDYHVCVRRFDQTRLRYVYPIQLAQPLPVVAIPLLPGDPDVPLDLQAVFTRCYEAGPYRREIRYDVEQPEPPLTTGQNAWAAAILREAGFNRITPG